MSKIYYVMGKSSSGKDTIYKHLAEENPELCRKYNIQQAPTLVSFTDGIATVIANASQIRSFAESAV